MTPLSGDPLEGVPQTVFTAQDPKLAGDFLTQAILKQPTALPTPKTWDELNMLGKAGRILDVPLALITKPLVAGETPSLGDIFSLNKTVGWEDVLFSHGFTVPASQQGGLGMNLILHPLNFIEGPFNLTEAGKLAEALKTSGFAEMAEKIVKPLIGIGEDAENIKALFKGYKIEEGSEIAQRIARAQASGFDLEFGKTFFDQAAARQRSLISLNVPFTSLTGIPIVPREVSMAVFGIPKVLRNGFLAGAKYVKIPGKGAETLADLALTTFLKPDLGFKKADLLFRGLLNSRKTLILKKYMDEFGPIISKFDQTQWMEGLQALERGLRTSGADYYKSTLTAQDLIKAGLKPELANDLGYQKVIRGMRDAFRDAYETQKASGIKVAQLADPINYVLHLIGEDGLAALKKSPMMAKTPAEFGTSHGSLIMRVLRDHTIQEANALAEKGLLEVIPGQKVKDFFQVNPATLTTTAWWRGARSATSAQYLRSMAEMAGHKIPSGASLELLDKIEAVGTKLEGAKSSLAALQRRISNAAPGATEKLKATYKETKARASEIANEKKVLLREKSAANKLRMSEMDKLVEKVLTPEQLAQAKEVSQNFGKSLSESSMRLGFIAKSKNQLIGDYVFSNVPFLNELDAHFGTFSQVDSVHDFLAFYDAIQGYWKGITLAPFPSYFFRNGLDDTWKNFLARVNPGSYVYAMQAFGKYSKSPEEWEALAKVAIPLATGQKATLLDLMRESEAIGVIPKMARHQDVLMREGDQIAKALNQGKIVPMMANVLSPAALAKKGLDNVVAKGFEMNRWRETITRFAHYVDKRIKGMLPTEAAESVFKYQFDYDQIPRWAKASLGRVFPFFSYMWFNIPFTLEMLAQRPGDIARLTNVLNSDIVPQVLGRNDRQLEAKMLREWVRNGAPFFMGQDPKDRDKYRYWMFDGTVSEADLLKLFDPMSFFVGQLSPLLREPLQQLSNWDFTMNKPITTFPGIFETDLQKEDMFKMSVPRRIAHVLRNVRAISEMDRILTLVADKKTPDRILFPLISRLIAGGSYIEVSEEKSMIDLKYRVQRIAADGKKAYEDAFRRGKMEEGWDMVNATMGQIMRGY